uniref:Putative secreted protein n=1 Tax=Panstrongylus lignarius TaxID=156445 RepID=A0A224Y699_9HEMI
MFNPIFALLTFSVICLLIESDGVRRIPKYLYSFTTSSLSFPKFHFSFLADLPPFLNTITFDLSIFILRLHF